MEKKPKKRISATGIGLIVLLVGGYLLMNMIFNTNGSGSGEFNRYRGPVLPMTSLNGAEGVAVQRNVDFDFSPYQNPKDYSTLGKGAAGITDTYVLTNTTEESRTMELVYGFQGQFIDHKEEFPTITVDGATIQARLYPSVDTESLVWDAHNFDKYKDVLLENNFLEVAMKKPEMADLPVKAYHFTDLAYNGDDVAAYPMLVVSFFTDEGTKLWTNIADSIGTVEGSDRKQLMFKVERGEAWIFSAGGELNDMEFGGNRDHNISENSAIEVEYNLNTYDTTLSAVMSQFAQAYEFWSVEGQETYPNPGFMTPEILLDGAIKRMEHPDWVMNAYGICLIDELFHQVVTESRMMYLVFPVELAPGQSVIVEASYIQEPSLDISGPKHYREGYDLATKLGSDLNFTKLTSSLTNTAPIELGDQNFGFDLEQGITDVILDLNVDRYYLEVRIKK